MVEEVKLDPSDFVLPVFVLDGDDAPEEAVMSMPGVVRRNIAGTIKAAAEALALGIPAIALFPCIDASKKDDIGTEGVRDDTLVLRAVRAIKAALPSLVVVTDVALDPYTSHGHDGVLDSSGAYVDNDRTVSILARMAVLHAEAGADMVAPSDMMDGRVAAIRGALDAAGRTTTSIMAYSAKFASAFYGPFRDAVGSSKAAGTRALDKRTYQLNPANPSEAAQETALDEQEGADFLMVKPAGPYLDILRDLKHRSALPLAAYQVSGEYAMLHAAAGNGWLDLRATMLESLLSIKRAGASMIFTYFAVDAAKALREAWGARGLVPTIGVGAAGAEASAAEAAEVLQEARDEEAATGVEEAGFRPGAAAAGRSQAGGGGGSGGGGESTSGLSGGGGIGPRGITVSPIGLGKSGRSSGAGASKSTS